MHFQHLTVALAALPALISGLPVANPDAPAEDPANAASRVEENDRKTLGQVSKIGGYSGLSGLSGLGGSATGSSLGALSSGTSGGGLSSLLSGLGSATGSADGSSTSSAAGTDTSPAAGSDSSSSSSPFSGFGSGGLSSLLGGGASSAGSDSGSSSGSSSPFGGFSLGGSTQNGVKDGKCEDITLIFARGTTEMGNMGSVIGPPLASALKKDNPSVAVQGVDYPASAAGNAQMGGSGGPTMATLAQQAKSKCPNTKIVLSGYSQGAMVVHNALSKFDGSNVAAVIVFGDPLNGSSFKGVEKSKALEVCGSSDFLCDRAGSDLKVNGSHLSYTSSAAQAAAWVAKTVGGGSGAAASGA